MNYCSALFLASLVSFSMVLPAAAQNAPINVSSMGIKKTAQFRIWKNNIEPMTTLGTFGSGLFCSDKSDIHLN